ncbi:DNA-binding helix-turn-helix protein [Phascolarctobacterium succinatutens YIT 12067]|jgi:transcriptional regulator with XRE-family HTH domain|uniref:DNA-binding helix-turn-helix protein n=3 Tax=Phascolarctobacterium succinatutens TaxID=626940 RepID=E8LBF0_9FIRM|nr:DNA-binding helix-turn-helix protein [Phascolarctobacterium succinatutens YIT 12067]
MYNILSEKELYIMELKTFINSYRTEHNLTMEQFAKSASLSKGYISMLEKGYNPQTGKKIIPSISALNNIAIATGTDLDHLLKIIDDIEVSLDSPAQDLIISNPQEAQLIIGYRNLTTANQKELLAYLDMKLNMQTK